MFRYYAALSLRHPEPVFPVVLYLHGGSGLIEEEYRAPLFGREVLRFRYQSVGLHSWMRESILEKARWVLRSLL